MFVITGGRPFGNFQIWKLHSHHRYGRGLYSSSNRLRLQSRAVDGPPPRERPHPYPNSHSAWISSKLPSYSPRLPPQYPIFRAGHCARGVFRSCYVSPIRPHLFSNSYNTPNDRAFDVTFPFNVVWVMHPAAGSLLYVTCHSLWSILTQMYCEVEEVPSPPITGNLFART